jgi:hypothetical protein
MEPATMHMTKHVARRFLMGWEILIALMIFAVALVLPPFAPAANGQSRPQ